MEKVVSWCLVSLFLCFLGFVLVRKTDKFSLGFNLWAYELITKFEKLMSLLFVAYELILYSCYSLLISNKVATYTVFRATDYLYAWLWDVLQGLWDYTKSINNFRVLPA